MNIKAWRKAYHNTHLSSDEEEASIRVVVRDEGGRRDVGGGDGESAGEVSRGVEGESAHTAPVGGGWREEGGRREGGGRSGIGTVGCTCCACTERVFPVQPNTTC